MTFAERFDGERVALDDGAADGAADAAAELPAEDAGVGEPLFDLGGDERRMHVRAYNHWVSLLKGRAFPSIADLDPAGIADFGPHSVLLDFSGGLDDPGIAYLGRALRVECELEPTITRVADVPSRSLLSRLTDHYLQIIANRAPIGFEAEFIGTRGRTTLYRGILTPFSSDGETIDFIYGVINWKELADPVTQAALDAELAQALREEPAATTDQPVWADGPSAEPAPVEVPVGVDATPAEEPAATDNTDPLSGSLPGSISGSLSGSLGDRLMVARESAAAVRAADTRSRSALYRALGRAHDFGLAAETDAQTYQALLADAGIGVQARAPMTPIAKLVFGADYDKTRLAEYAGVLAHARRHAVPAGDLPRFLDGVEGGIKAVVAAERAARRPAPAPDAAPDPVEAARATLRDASALATVGMAVDIPGDAEFVLLVARRRPDGALDVVAAVEAQPLVDAAVKRAAA